MLVPPTSPIRATTSSLSWVILLVGLFATTVFYDSKPFSSSDSSSFYSSFDFLKRRAESAMVATATAAPASPAAIPNLSLSLLSVMVYLSFFIN